MGTFAYKNLCPFLTILFCSFKMETLQRSVIKSDNLRALKLNSNWDVGSWVDNALLNNL
jgi:hypothetical protein